MKRTETRLENLERAAGGENPLAVHKQGEDFVKLINPPERRGERMSPEDFERKFPDGKLVEIVYLDGEEWTNLR